MKISVALAGFGAIAAGVLAWRQSQATLPDYASQDLGIDFSVPTYTADAFDGVEPATPPQQSASRDDQNAAAALAMVRAAEGTKGEGGYGALFGWPAAGRSFDPYAVPGHPNTPFRYTDKAGKTFNTTAAGAYQIIYPTWSSYQPAFRVWAAKNGYTVQGFTPETQDAFALFLMDRRGALADFKAGRVDAGLSKARAEWASLPGAGYNQPERSRAYVVAAFQAAGGMLA